jgi:hypothetical protein
MIDKLSNEVYHADTLVAIENLNVHILAELEAGRTIEALITSLFEKASRLLLAEYGPYNSVATLADALATFARNAPVMEQMMGLDNDNTPMN